MRTTKLSLQKIKIISSLIILFFGTLLFNSCKKDVTEKTSLDSPKVSPNIAGDCPTGYYWDPLLRRCVHNDIEASYAGVPITYEVSNQILRFNSLSDVNAVLNQLDSDYDIYNDSYDAQYPNYTVDQLDAVDSINNFDEFRKFKDFENLFSGYSSKRKQIENTENTWLANNMTGIDPDSTDYAFDDALNTIFNSNYSFKIGTDIYQLRGDGIYVNGILQDASNARIANTTALDCFGKRKSVYDYPPGTNKRYKLKVAVHSIIVRSEAKAKVVSFKQSGNGWKRSRTEMAVYAGGNIYAPPSCTFNFSFSSRKPTSGFKKRKQLKVKYWTVGAGAQTIYKTKTGEVSGTYELPNGYSAGLSL